MRRFIEFTWKNAFYRLCSDQTTVMQNEIIFQRGLLESYIKRDNNFLTSLVPVCLLPDAPDIAVKMEAASRLTNVGPMAAVAGAIAQAACEAAVKHGASEAIVENGGDIFIISNHRIRIGLYTGKNKLENKLALSIEPGILPLSVCSSSSRMGHSLSFGNCDLACVTAKDASLADAAATFACNSVKSSIDIDKVLKDVMQIPHILGVLIVEGDKIGMAGDLPDLVKNIDPASNNKISHHPSYIF